MGRFAQGYATLRVALILALVAFLYRGIMGSLRIAGAESR